MKKPDRKWMAILAVLAGMAWAAGASSHYQGFVAEKPKSLGS
jgi:hypothetical protein